MNEIIDKVILLLSCLVLYLYKFDANYAIIPVIIVIFMSSLFLYFEDARIKVFGNLAFLLLCIFIPNYLIFIPVIIYDILLDRYQYVVFTIPLVWFINNGFYSNLLVSFSIILLLISSLLKYKTLNFNKLKSEYNDLRDNSSEVSILLNEKNQTLLKNQDYKINLATLNERNRISREIHDNIGHMLSRSILQVGALLTVAKDSVVQEGLSELKDSLSQGMDQIRNSIHHMYDESIDLYTQINQIINNFSYCPVHFEFDLKTTPSIQLKYCFIAITKEALANIMRHSNASRATVIFREHPAMYQLVIQDNGTLDENERSEISKIIDQSFGGGMGLRNISDRVKSFKGNINITIDRGFKIFITVPKNIETKE